MEQKEWFTTPNGNRVEMFFREDTSDRSVIESIFTNDEYDLRGKKYQGWALDIGAHVGAWAIAAAVDNPELYVLGLEAVYENVLMFQRNVRLNNLEHRIKPLYRAASSTNHPVQVNYGYKGNEFATYNRFIGNLNRPTNDIDTGAFEIQTVQGLRLTRVLRILGEDVRLMKIDCEGCEWRFLKSKEVGRIHEIVGEYHDRPSKEIRELLEPTHHVSITKDDGGIGNFKAVRR